MDLKPKIVNVETAPNFLPLCEALPESHWQQMLEQQNGTASQEGKLGESDEGKEGTGLALLVEEVPLQRSFSNVNEHVEEIHTVMHSMSHGVSLRLSESR